MSGSRAISFGAVRQGTRYTALAMHGNAETRRQQARRGFHDGWQAALD